MRVATGVRVSLRGMRKDGREGAWECERGKWCFSFQVQMHLLGGETEARTRERERRGHAGARLKHVHFGSDFLG